MKWPLIVTTMAAAGLVTSCIAAAPDGPAQRPAPAAVRDGEGFVKPDDETLKQKLTPLQFKVTQKDGTEPPFKNEFWDNKASGLYVDVVSGEPLFASVHKYESGTGWPSFWTTVAADNVVEHVDRKLFMKRTEVRSRKGDSHLGHVFPDGPEPTGLRYCVNSAALRFVPVERLEEEGYAEFVELFAAEKGQASKE